jgi:PAS domain S-box-containing protein
MTIENNNENPDLRHRAEKILQDRVERLERMDRQETRNVMHELQVQQIELEIQNQELRDTRKALEEARVDYARLYDNAPVGYASIDPSGIIKQANETLARMMGKEVSRLKGKAFADFLTEDDAGVFRSKFRSFFRNPIGKKMEARLATEASGLLHALLEAVPHLNSPDSRSEVHDELLMTISDITDRKQAEMRLETALKESRSREEEVAALLKGARAVLEQDDFQATARKVFDLCNELIGATSGYVALLSDDGMENEVLFLESGGLPCDVDAQLPMPIRGLRGEAYEKGTPVFHNDFMNSKWIDYMPEGHVTLKNVMFAPLILQGKTVGIIGIANKPSYFMENDARLAGGFGELAAIALQKGRQLDERNKIENERVKIIGELKEALSRVKQLTGLLPICMHCKKIRDDQGYWNQLESYISKYSEVMFSHGLCPECAKKHYPEYDLNR